MRLVVFYSNGGQSFGIYLLLELMKSTQRLLHLILRLVLEYAFSVAIHLHINVTSCTFVLQIFFFPFFSFLLLCSLFVTLLL